MTEEANKENTQSNSQPEQKAAELERMIAEKESEIAALKKSAGELKEQLSAANKSLAEAVAGYKEKIIQMNPGVTGELIKGNTIKAIEESIALAMALGENIKKLREKEIQGSRVPAGAPGRRAADVSAMSPREKIQYAVGGKK